MISKPPKNGEQALMDEALGLLVSRIPGRDQTRKISLRDFVREAWPIIEPKTEYVHGWHIDAICDHLTAVTDLKIKNLIINMPPRHAKSLLCSVFWFCWVWTQQPSSRWLYSSYAQALSVRDSQKCRRIITSDWYRKHWGHVFELTKDQNLKQSFENSRTGQRIATSVEAQATGFGGDYVIVDDPINAQEALKSTIAIENANDWWDQSMSTRGNDPRKARFVVIMQRLHDKDLSGHLIEQGGYEHLVLPAEYDPKVFIQTSLDWKDPRKQPGELLWPERVDMESLATFKRKLGPFGYASQFQQNPVPSEGGLFKHSWLQYYTEPPKCTSGVISVDCTFKSLDESDYVVIQVWGKRGPNFYLMHQVRRRMGLIDTLKAIRDVTRQHRFARTVVVEDKANGSAVVEVLKKKIPGVIAYTPHESKEARAASISVYFESGNVYLPDPKTASWVVDYITELTRFPKSRHDDQVDCTSQALIRLTEGRDMLDAYNKFLGTQKTNAQVH